MNGQKSTEQSSNLSILNPNKKVKNVKSLLSWVISAGSELPLLFDGGLYSAFVHWPINTHHLHNPKVVGTSVVFSFSHMKLVVDAVLRCCCWGWMLTAARLRWAHRRNDRNPFRAFLGDKHFHLRNPRKRLSKAVKLTNYHFSSTRFMSQKLIITNQRKDI